MKSAGQIKEALEQAGIEIYGLSDDGLQIAERVRFHLMDSGIRVRLNEARVAFTARSQQSDHPDEPAENLLEEVRRTVGHSAVARGYCEEEARTTPITNPSDQSQVLDIWHEVSYSKPIQTTADAIAEVQWALHLNRYL